MCSAEQWLQFDIGPPTLVTAVVTKGRGDGRKKHWVTEYRLSYSNDSRLWHFYKDEPLQDIKVVSRQLCHVPSLTIANLMGTVCFTAVIYAGRSGE